MKVVVALIIFCGLSIVESGAGAAEPNTTHLEAADVVEYAAIGGPVRSEVIGSVDPNSGFKFRLELDSQGAAIRQATFSEYNNRDRKNPQPLIFLSPVHFASGLDIMSMANRELVFVEQQRQLSLDRLSWKSLGSEKAQNGSQSASFEATITDSAGAPVVKLTKTYKISPNSYLVECNIAVDNLTGDEQKIRLNLDGPVGVGREDSRSDERKIVGGFRDPKGQIVGIRIGASNFDSSKTFAEEILGGEYQKNQEFLWASVVNKYFAAILVPLPENGKKSCDWINGRRNQAGDRETMHREKRGLFYSLRRFFTGKSYEEEVEKTGKFGRFYNPDGQRANGDENVGVSLEIDFANLGPVDQANASRTYGFQLYLGPKDKSLFDKNELYKTLGFVQTIDFMACCCPSGIINPLAFAILAIMKWMYGFIGNYGLVIIILVLLMRLALHPVTRYSQVALSKTSKLAPMVEEIKKKYANNKTELNKHLMELYRKQGASPVMGMLPMFVQLPIWIALWSAVYTSIDLRGAPFLPVWITDLSAPDALFIFKAIPIPLFGKIDSFNLLPILMGVAFYLQQKLTPSQAGAATNPQMAQQQKIMMIMLPVLFPLTMYTAPSGVNLYIMASTFAGVVEQYVIKKHIAEREQAEADGLVAVTSKTGGKVKKKKPKPFFRI